MNCELCGFKNPKITATAVVFNNGKLLLAKRNQEPHKGQWDFIGGYAEEGEDPKTALKREVQEELGVGCRVDFIGAFPGTDEYKGQVFPLVSFAYLVELQGDIQLNQEENSAVQWVELAELNDVAFDSNKKILKHLKDKFLFPMHEVHSLTKQLDDTAAVHEYSLLRAVLNGYIAKEYDQGQLIGMGWIFPRQTMLRRQAVVEDMIVREDMRGRGLGRKLLQSLVDWAKEQGIEVIELTSNPKREAANKLYQNFGFQLHPTNHYLYRVE